MSRATQISLQRGKLRDSRLDPLVSARVGKFRNAGGNVVKFGETITKKEGTKSSSIAIVSWKLSVNRISN